MSHIRCAIYTRKSSEEGLEQSFNSLDAQREACEAYIRSQRHEGWQAIHTHYDDGGFSGGNMERPALKRLIADINLGKVNAVVVYKVDRLTRSLADFAKIIERFDVRQVSFVSVTQHFNTTTSMGRLTLNVLLSFAQFEREVTGERIRDKIAASKKKGMWMGGTVPLGYEAADHKLHIKEPEATTVRTIFNEFLRLGNVALVKESLRASNIRSREGNFASRGSLYQMLRNPAYVGLIRHKKNTYLGQHEAILDRHTWDRVQTLLTENRQGERRKSRTTKVSLFTGIIFGAAGNLYTPTHSKKGGRRYRYYTSQAVIRKREDMNVPTRIPAHELEMAVSDRILQLLNSPQELLKIVGHNGSAPLNGRSGILQRASTIFVGWDSRPAAEREDWLKSIIDRVVVNSDHVEIRMPMAPLLQQLGAIARKSSASSESSIGQVASINCSFRHIQKSKSLRLVIRENEPVSEPTRIAMLKAIARARHWYGQIVTGEAASLMEIAQLHGISIQYVKNIFRLAFLGPEAIGAILNGEYRSELSLSELGNCVATDWREQKSILSSSDHRLC